jgi:exodeoxyribonuclease V alpha subunit
MPPPVRRVQEDKPAYDTSGALATLECTVERVTFHNEENGYAVIKVAPMEAKAKARGRGNDDVIAVLGNFPLRPVEGESLKLYGTWIRHPQYGHQFKMERYETLRPATAAAIEKYLGSGLVKGIGPKTATIIVKKFGEETLNIIEFKPERLMEVKGMGEKRVAMIAATWAEQKEVRNIMLFLQGHGVTPTYAVKIYRTYKERSIEVVERNPYQLATDIWGIGFKSADKIAQNIGMPLDAPERLEAGLTYVLNQEMDGAGHCFLPREDLITAAHHELNPTPGVKKPPAPTGEDYEKLDQSLHNMVEKKLLIAETVIGDEGQEITGIYTPSIHTTEKAVAHRIHTLLNSPWRQKPTPSDIDKLLEGLPGADKLSEEQTSAVRRSLTEPVMVLTGGPGCGKTFTTNVIVAALEKRGKRIQIAAPTGRAAKRASEVTGKEAKTIHRLLVFDPEKRGFKHGPDEPLELDVLIIDEASMLDISLTHNTIRAVPDGAQIIFVGDVDQLPSVGPGNVLSDLIRSEHVPVARLTQVFRQAATSHIITNAHAINKGKMPELLPPSAIQAQGADCIFLPMEEFAETDEVSVQDTREMIYDAALKKISAVVSVSLPKLGFKRDEITVLVPMQRGALGAKNLNEVLQTVLNPAMPSKNEHKRGPIVFREGDRVMQRVNNYDKNVFNGDVGYILSIDTEESMLVVDYPEGPAEYDFVDTDQISHAFAMTIHKCLPKGEKIRLKEHGFVPIEEVKIGDLVETGTGAYKPVVNTFATGKKPVYRLTTRAGFVLHCSAEHPIFVATTFDDAKTPHWVRAADMIPNHHFAAIAYHPTEARITSDPFYFDPIASVEKLDSEEEMFDIEVEDIHSFVSENGFICHNSQGSEYPACLIVLHTSHYMLLQRNLIYTALTRAKKMGVFIGTKNAISMAVKNRNTVPRNTRLAQRIQELSSGLGTNGLSRRSGQGKGENTQTELPTPPLPGRLF